MEILAHRGLWKSLGEQNTKQAIIRSFENGFGIETDLRDHQGQVVISHDMPSGEVALRFDELLQLYKTYGTGLKMALNIKADGLQEEIKKALAQYDLANEDFFFFDMSVPDALGYVKQNFPCFTRYSEYEPSPNFLEEARGVWLDGFQQDCLDLKVISNFLNKTKSVAIVSPELHKRAYQKVWSLWRSEFPCDEMMLCTDHPQEAEIFFNVSN